MNREQIEQEAASYVEDILGLDYIGEAEAKKSFIAGASWRINSVWHDAREEPIKEKGRWLAFCGGIKVFMCEKWDGQFLWSGYASMLGIIMWAYVEDLIPERKEKEQ